MLVFVAWSNKERGGRVLAEAVEKWIQNYNKRFGQTVSVFNSSKIQGGENWTVAVQDNLVKADLGILCVAKDAWKSPWFNFEAGGLTVSTYDSRNKQARVIPLEFNLFNDEDSAINPPKRPLQHVQNILFGEKGLNDLFRQIDRQLHILWSKEEQEQQEKKIQQWIQGKFPEWSEALFHELFRELFQESFMKDAAEFCDICARTESNKIFSLACPLARIAEAERLREEVNKALTVIDKIRKASETPYKIEEMAIEMESFRNILSENNQRSLSNQESARKYAVSWTEPPKGKPEKVPFSIPFLQKKDKELDAAPKESAKMIGTSVSEQKKILDDAVLRLCNDCLAALETPEGETDSRVRKINIEIIRNRLKRYFYLADEARIMLQDDRYADKPERAANLEEYHNSRAQLSSHVRNLRDAADLLERLARKLR